MPFVLTRKLNGVPIFWTGFRHVNGEPQYTLWISDAFKTRTCDELRAAVATHPEINQNEWKFRLWSER